MLPARPAVVWRDSDTTPRAAGSEGAYSAGMDSTMLRTLKALGLAVLVTFAVTLSAACNDTSPTEAPGGNQQDEQGEEQDDDGGGY